MEQAEALDSRGRRIRRWLGALVPAVALLGAAVLALLGAAVLALLGAAPALAAGYATGYYAGHTSQGKAITFVVASGKIKELQTEISDRCTSGSLLEFLHPYTVKIGAGGKWSHTAAEIPAQPTIYHGRVANRRATGTIEDTSDNSRGVACHGHITYSARPSSPLRVGAATVGAHGADVLLSLDVPPAFDGNETVPNTDLGLLVYGSNTGCPATYAAADALARQSGDFLGLISDAYVTADWSFADTKKISQGKFIFDVTTNTLVPDATGASPFSTVCAMLYSGTPAPRNPGANVALETAHGPLVAGAGAPSNQP